MENRIRIGSIFKLVIISAFLTILITGCKNKEVAQIENQNMETDVLKEDIDSEEAPVEPEEDDNEAPFSFEEMNYTTFLKNNKGEEVVGFNIPFGWFKNEEQSDESFAYLSNGQYSNESISISYIEGYSDNRYIKICRIVI